MNFIYKIEEFHKLDLNISTSQLIFLFGDLGSGKTTLSKYILKEKLGVKEDILSPTYTYYNKYVVSSKNKLKMDLYHFDLYRLSNYDEFVSIGGEEILDNNNGIIIIEWPEIILDYYKPDISIKIGRTKYKNKRKIIIT